MCGVSGCLGVVGLLLFGALFALCHCCLIEEGKRGRLGLAPSFVRGKGIAAYGFLFGGVWCAVMAVLAPTR